MLIIPPRGSLAALEAAANAVARTAILGFARGLPDGRVSVLYSYVHGIGEYLVDASELPAVLDPSFDGVREAPGDTLATDPARPIEWQLRFAGAQRVVSMSVGPSGSTTRLWIGLHDVRASGDERAGRTAVSKHLSRRAVPRLELRHHLGRSSSRSTRCPWVT